MYDRETSFRRGIAMALGALGVALTACGDTDDAVVAAEGEVARVDPSAAVVTIDGHTLAGDGMSAFRCTGILLSPEVVLTSGACTRGLSYGYPNASTSWAVRRANDPEASAVSAGFAESAWPITIDEHTYSEYAVGEESSRDEAKASGARDIGLLILHDDASFCMKAYPSLATAGEGERAIAFARSTWIGEDAYGNPVDREVAASPAGKLAPFAAGWATLDGVDPSRVAGESGPPKRCSFIEKLFLGCPTVGVGQADRGGPIVRLAGDGEPSSIVGVATGARVGDSAEIALIASSERPTGEAPSPGSLEWITSIVEAHPGSCDAN